VPDRVEVLFAIFSVPREVASQIRATVNGQRNALVPVKVPVAVANVRATVREPTLITLNDDPGAHFLKLSCDGAGREPALFLLLLTTAVLALAPAIETLRVVDRR